MNRIRAMFTNRGIEFWRSLVLAVSFVIGVSLVFWFLGRLIGLDQGGALAHAFQSAARSSWALPAVIIIFTAASFVGMPQFLLIAVAVAALGPVRGFLFSYLATLVSSSANYWLARMLGAGWFKRRRGVTLATLSEFVGRNGFFSAMIVRIVPSAPFVVVNMGMGVVGVPYLSFLAGTGVGIIPKTAMISLLGKVIERAGSGDWDAIVYLVLAVAAWVGLALAARAVLRFRSGPGRPQA